MKRGERVPMDVRLERRRRIDPITGCWEWQGAIDSRGYGRIYVEKKLTYTHRVSWAMTNGPIPDRLVIDHVCENRRCFNPAHLDLVTYQENTNRRRNAPAGRTHCPSGHRYAGINLRVYVDRKGYARRYCVTCQNIRNAKRVTLGYTGPYARKPRGHRYSSRPHIFPAAPRNHLPPRAAPLRASWDTRPRRESGLNRRSGHHAV